MLETREISRKYSGKRVLDHISFTIEPGSIYALLGPNGSGKTTWMRLAAGLLRPSEGKLFLDGVEIGRETKKRIVYMPTENYFYPWMNVEGVGTYYQSFFKDFSMERYHRYMSLMGIEGKQKLRQLSTGMLAKVKLAATLSRNAEVYLLDEPMNGIDLLARDQMVACLLDVSNQATAIVISSHHVEEIEGIVDRVLFLKEGRLLGADEVERIRDEEGLSLADAYRSRMGEREEKK